MLAKLIYLATLLQSVSGHGYLSQPAAVYSDTTTKTAAVAIVNANVLYPNIKWNDSPERNSIQYQMLISSNRIGDLKSFYSTHVNGCPNNQLNTVVDVSGIKSMKWQNDEFKEGFTPSHTGPCEAWIDDTKVFTDNDCSAHFKAYPAELPIDYSVCKNKSCLFAFYWIGLHEANWQLYKSCVMISGDSTASTGNSSGQVSIIVGSTKYTCNIY